MARVLTYCQNELWVDGPRLFLRVPRVYAFGLVLGPLGGTQIGRGVWAFKRGDRKSMRKLVQLVGASKECVRVRVSGEAYAWRENENALFCGGYVLAVRRRYDRSATHYAALVQGEIPPWGGWKDVPRVEPSRDAAFELAVRRDFAESEQLPILGLAGQDDAQRDGKDEF